MNTITDSSHKPDRKAFEEAKLKILGTQRQRLGIGTLAEKTVHAILKNYYEPREEKQEVPLAGYVADIFTGQEVIEIQTRQLDTMKDKLSVVLALDPVTVVHPIPREKWLIWVDQDSGALTPRRKSPLKGSPYTAFTELYGIKMFLNQKNLRLRLALLDIEEYKLQNGQRKGRKKGAASYDRIPLEFVQEVTVDSREDYLQFIPPDLADEDFTSKDFAQAARIKIPLAQTVLHVLYHVGAVDRVGKKGRLYLYRAMPR